MLNCLIVGMGGFFGSISRYLMAGFVQKFSGSFWFPYGTMGVNLLGCLLIGLLGGLADNRALFRPEIRLFFLVGALGGFTTFSTFGYETLALLRNQQIFSAFANVGIHVICGIGAVWLGYTFSNL